MIVCINGKFTDEKKATVSVLDNGFLYADGFYDTLRVYNGVLFELSLHLKRIESTARVMNIPLPHRLEVLSDWLSQIVQKNSLRDARVRMTVTRGAQGRDFSKAKKPTIVLTCEKLKIRNGSPRVESACTMRFERSEPSRKTLGGLAVLPLAMRTAKENGCEHAIGIDGNGFVREAATSNVFVVRSGRLLTPKNNILPGLTRSRVIALARSLKLRVRIKNFKRSLLLSSDEVFLTNRVREIIPIVSVNGKKIGTGKVGSVTKKLADAYETCVRQYASCTMQA